jgi:hypothetical protein
MINILRKWFSKKEQVKEHSLENKEPFYDSKMYMIGYMLSCKLGEILEHGERYISRLPYDKEKILYHLLFYLDLIYNNVDNDDFKNHISEKNFEGRSIEGLFNETYINALEICILCLADFQEDVLVDAHNRAINISKDDLKSDDYLLSDEFKGYMDNMAKYIELQKKEMDMIMNKIGEVKNKYHL